jgi:lysophospholipase L1-like esterase
VLLVTAATAAAAGIFGQNTIYAGNAEGFNPVTTPYVSLVMSGIHERVYPWVLLIGSSPEQDEVDEAIAALLAGAEQPVSSGKGTQSAAPKYAKKDADRADRGEDAGKPAGEPLMGSGENGESGEKDVSGNDAGAEYAGQDVSGNDAGAEYAGQDVSGNDAGAEYAGLDVSGNDAGAEYAGLDVSGNDAGAEYAGQDVSGNDAGAEYAEEDASAGDAEEESSGEENSGEDAAGSEVGGVDETEYPSEAARLAAEQENDTYIRAESMPEGVCSPVLQAEDYGVADRRYLAPEGTVWNEDTDGIFAENGDYYRLREVNDYYFTDAIFIGDSRTVGLYEYGGFGEMSTFMARESLSVYSMWKTSMTCHTYDGPDVYTTLLDQLQKVRYAKIYLSLGVNELGFPTSREFYQKYREAVAVIRQLQPDAIIYIQGIMHVSKSRSSSDGIFNNKLIVERNTAIASLANGHDIFYIDMNSEICDEDGNIPADITFDGVHLYARGYTLWHEFLLKNAIVRDVGRDFRGAGPEEAEE